MAKKSFQAKPIGTIKAGEEGFQILIEPAFRPALKELDGFSYINVLFWCDQVDDAQSRSFVQCDKPYAKAPDKVGIFATRSPARPNPIALTAVAAMHIDHQQGVIHIPFIDAEDGTPVIDIKPYLPALDRVKDVAVPAWCQHWPKWYEESAKFDWAAEFVNAR